MSARIFLVRHGETEWSRGGKHTSTSEVPLSKEGEKQVEKAREAFVGEGKLINPFDICRIYSSPRNRAKRTVELLHLGVHAHHHFKDRTTDTEETTKAPTNTSETTVEVTPWLQEWDYGDYEGLTIGEVHRLRKDRGLDKGRNWNIWLDGCEGGESPQQVSDRLDHLIAELKTQIGRVCSERPGGQNIPQPRNIVCVAHGHILAALALRWAQQPLKNGMRLLMDTAGVAVLGFEHDDLNEPAIVLGRKAGK
ncbi:phosphoglycerate mutase family protein [Thermoascus aurantiacus ATCC 26904]